MAKREPALTPGQMTDDQKRCWQTLCDVLGGEHHCPEVRSASPWGIRCSLDTGRLSTTDMNTLTVLVLAAHRDCVRVELTGGSPYRVGVMLHARKPGDKSIMYGHPTLDDLAEMCALAKVP